jgi:uracil-DNA glycosylase family 4
MIEIVTPASRKRVPNEKSIREANYRIAIIGEAPGEDEENYHRPFVGKSGQFLTNILDNVGIDRYACLIGNICQFRPPQNDIGLFDWHGVEIQDGLEKLSEDIANYNPNICVLLGNTPLRAAVGTKAKISEWRGSLFISDLPGPFHNRKCVPSLHPAYILREFAGFPLLKFDLTRALAEGVDPSLKLPHRELITDLDADRMCYILDSWPAGRRCSVDIEGSLREGWPCVSVSGSPTKSFCIVWNRYDEVGHVRVLSSFARLMYRTDVPKVLQNQLYDNFVMSYGHGIIIRNVAEDTMIKGFSIYAELSRSLATQASVWTRQPLWKDDSMYGEVGEGLYRGCAMDSAITLEICSAQDNVLVGAPLTHYRKIIELQNVFLYMELRGIRYNQENVNQLLEHTREKLKLVGDRLTISAGKELRGPRGSLSAKRLIETLYVTKGYPPQYVKEAGRRTTKLTSDIEAILTLKRTRPDDAFLSDVLLHRHLEGIRETLQITADNDGRVRCGYSLEAETGRVKCYKSPTGSGANMQTIQKNLRGNYVADPGYDFFEVDLEGADGWTVAAHCARLGDSTMLADYMAGMKPAKIVALIYWFGPEINELDRSDLKWLHDVVFPIVLKLAGKWLYLGCKRVQHGSSYMMGIPTMCLNILKDSFKESGTPIYMEQSTARSLQNAFFSRYPGVLTWHKWAESKLVADGKLTSASGQCRLFFGRRFGDGVHETVKEFLAHEPQSNTTWAIMLAALKLWNDPLNRQDNGSLIIEPLHQVHDSLCGQWPQWARSWAVARIHNYFKNELEIAGMKITIPFDGKWGPSWGECTNKI